jgi:IS605 OrfB family transposase
LSWPHDNRPQAEAGSMERMSRTFTTRLTGDHPALEAWGDLQGRMERRLHSALMSGREWTGDLATTAWRGSGFSAKRLEHVYRNLKGKHDSAMEAAKFRARELERKIEAKAKDIDRKAESLARLKSRLAKLDAKRTAVLGKLKTAKPKYRTALEQKLTDLDREIGAGRAEREKRSFGLHQHKRRLGVLKDRLVKAERKIERPSLCFGSRRLFLSQHALKENGYASHGEWLEDWRKARSSQFLIEGAARAPSGNEFVRATVGDDDRITLEVRLPEALHHLAQVRFRAGNQDHAAVLLHSLHFNHGHEAVLEALRAHERKDEERSSIAWRFVRDGKGWLVSVILAQAMPEVVTDIARGALGVDLNEDHVALGLVAPDGNIRQTFRLPLVTYGLSSEARLDLIRKTCKGIALLAKEHGVPAVSEKLDFSRKKADLEVRSGRRRARMLSSFAYAEFDRTLASACARSGVGHVRVNPAFTSIIGAAKTAGRYGLSVHRAASIAIARRAMGHSERLPSPAEVVLRDGTRTALPTAASTSGRHVWSAWRQVARGMRAVLAARARAGDGSAPARGSPRTGADGRKPLVRGRTRVRPEAGPRAGPAGVRVPDPGPIGHPRAAVAPSTRKSD